MKKFIHKNGKLSEPHAQYWFLQMVQGLEALYDNSILHRDLKPENVLLKTKTRKSIIKLADFGLSKKIELDKVQKGRGEGTPLYASPEVVN